MRKLGRISSDLNKTVVLRSKFGILTMISGALHFRLSLIPDIN